MTNNFKLYLLAFLWFFSFLLVGMIFKLYSGCLSAVDFSIYQEAIIKIASFESLNPFIYIRDINIFNDHFDPVIIFASFFSILTAKSPAGLLIFEWVQVALIGVVMLTDLNDSKENDRWMWLSALVMGLFSRGINAGLAFPIHPTLWAAGPIFLLFRAIIKNNHKQVLIFSVLLCFYKENFAFSTITLAFAYILPTRNKSPKTFGLLFGISLAFILFELGLRKSLMGSTVSYGSKMLPKIMEDPFSLFTTFNYLNFFKLLYPFIIPLFLVFKFDKDFGKKQAVPLLLFFTPLFAMHFITNKTHYHYGAQFVAPFMAIIFYSGIFKSAHLSNKLKTLCLLLFVGSSISSYSKTVKFFFVEKSNRCNLEMTKIDSIQKAKEALSKLDGKLNVAATAGLIPPIMTTKHNFYHISGYSRIRGDMDIIILPKKEISNIAPLSPNQVRSLYDEAKKIEARTIYEDDLIYVGRSIYPKEFFPAPKY